MMAKSDNVHPPDIPPERRKWLEDEPAVTSAMLLSPMDEPRRHVINSAHSQLPSHLC